jgi:hypothetical protein
MLGFSNKIICIIHIGTMCFISNFLEEFMIYDQTIYEPGKKVKIQIRKIILLQ